MSVVQRLRTVAHDGRTRADRHQADVQSKHQCNFEQPLSEVNLPVDASRKLTTWGCGGILGLVYAKRPKLSRYWTGLSEPSDTLIRFSLYQRM
jgi:hypothetical protein